MALFSSLRWIKLVGFGRKWLLSPILSRAGNVCHPSSVSAHRQANSDPSYVPGFCQVPPCLHPELSVLSAWPMVQHSCVLCQTQLNFKTPRCRDLHLSSGIGFPCTVAGAGLSQKTLMRLRLGSKFRINRNVQLVPGFAALRRCLCS